MNKNSTYTLVVAIVTLLSGCINSDLSHCGKQAQLVIKAVNKYGDDITPSGATGDVMLFVFDDENRFLSHQYLPVQDIRDRRNIEVKLRSGEAFRYVAWSNISDTVKMFDFDPNWLLSQNKVKPLALSDNIVSIPADIFYGRKRMSCADDEYSPVTELVIKRSVAQIHVAVVGMPAGDSPGQYLVVLSDKEDKLNFENQILLLGGNGIYVKKAMWFQKGVMMGIEDAFRALPSLGGAKTVSLYKGQQVVAAVTHDIENKPIAPRADERINVLINLNQDNPSETAGVEMRMVVSDWDEVVEWKEW
ncbi:FimB/Mfa2 family fimbrial subunit [Proteiniphilum sp. UBA7639]|nr:FimB/Mfa2 family fimbrial subunit [Proteiniphilum sp. UBA7639]